MSNNISKIFLQFPLSRIQTSIWSGFPDQWCAEHGCAEVGIHDHPMFINPDAIEEAFVRIISPELLGTYARLEGATGCMVDICDNSRIFLLNRDGEVLSEVFQSIDIIHNEAHVDDESEEGETVGRAIICLPSSELVEYIVSVHTGYEIEDHSSVGGNRVIVYRRSKKFDLDKWIREERVKIDLLMQCESDEVPV